MPLLLLAAVKRWRPLAVFSGRSPHRPAAFLPVVLFSLGISGSWIGNFTQLAPYKPYFIGATVAFLGTGYWLVHRASKLACIDGGACAQPLPNRLVKVTLIVATVLVIAAFGFDYVAPYLLS